MKSFLFSASLPRLAVLAVALILSSAPERLSAAVADRVVRATVAGIDVVAYPTTIKDVVTFRGSLPAGDFFSPENNLAVASLVGGMLDKGTVAQDQFAIAQKLDAVGASLSFSVSDTLVTFRGKCLRKDIALVIGLLAEQLRTPAFAEEDLAKLKKQMAGGIQRSLERPDTRAAQAFADAIYPAGHPNHEPAAEVVLAAIETATVADLRAFHQKFYGPAELILVAVGDVDPVALQAEIARAFAGWSGGVKLPDYKGIAVRPPTQADLPVFMPDKTSVSVIIGQATGLRHSDPDALPLRVANTILGSGFTGRLMATVRDQEGLTYGIYSALSNDTFTAGDWRIGASFSPELLEKGLASTRRELMAWYSEGVTESEVERTKTNLAGQFQVGLATTEGMATVLLSTIHRGYTLDWIDSLPDRLVAVSTAQVNDVIRRHLRPDALVLVRAGTLPNVSGVNSTANSDVSATGSKP